DFEMEKKAIIEEIGMYEDQPTWSAYDRAKKAFFADHPLGNSVLGTPDSIAALTRDHMQGYFDKRYVAANITVSAAGNFSFPNLVKLVDKSCGHWNTGRAPRQGIREAPPRTAFQVVNKDKVTQEHVFMISPGPAADA